MGLIKTVGLVIVSGAVGSMAAGMAAPHVVKGVGKDGKPSGFIDAKHAGAVQTGLTAGAAALTYVLLAGALR